jgi:hypothetical protein
MTRGQYITVVLASWVGAGLATALRMARRGRRDQRLLTADPQRDPAAGVKVQAERLWKGTR